MGRSVGLDVHRDFCEVAILDEQGGRRSGRVPSTPQDLQVFAESLAGDDRVALEVTGNAWEIARILEAHVARVIVVSPSDTAIRQARAKTDRLDALALALARLLAAGSLDAVWTPDEPVRVMRRRLARRSQLITSRSRVKNEVHAVLVRRLKGRPPCSDLFGLKGRAWLAELALPVEERETVDAGLRQIDFLDAEVAEVDRVIARHALQWPEIGRLMTVPGVNVTVAATFLAAVGDIRRSPTQAKLVGYLGLDPRVRQSGHAPAKHGRISKQGSAPGRHALVEAAWSTVRSPGPLRAFYQRVRARRGHQSRDRRRGPQAGLPVLVSADPRRGLRPRPAVADQEETAAPGTDRRRAEGPRQDQHLVDQRCHAPGRTRLGRTSRAGLRTHRCRLASRRSSKGRRERDTGARITKTLQGPSRAADHKPLTSALRYVNRPRPPAASQRRPHPSRPT